METKELNLEYIQDKVNKVRKSCVTPEHREVYKRFAQLYRQKIEHYNNDFGYQFRVDLMIIIVSTFLIGGLLGSVAIAYLM